MAWDNSKSPRPMRHGRLHGHVPPPHPQLEMGSLQPPVSLNGRKRSGTCRHKLVVTNSARAVTRPVPKPNEAPRGLRRRRCAPQYKTSSGHRAAQRKEKGVAGVVVKARKVLLWDFREKFVHIAGPDPLQSTGGQYFYCGTVLLLRESHSQSPSPDGAASTIGDP